MHKIALLLALYLFIGTIIAPPLSFGEECPPASLQTSVKNVTPVTLRLNNEIVTTVYSVYIDSTTNRAMVDISELSNLLGFKYELNKELSQLTISKKGATVLTVYLNSSEALVGSTTTQLDTPVTIIADKTMVPLRFVVEILGGKVVWNAKTRTIDLRYNKD